MHAIAAHPGCQVHALNHAAMHGSMTALGISLPVRQSKIPWRHCRGPSQSASQARGGAPGATSAARWSAQTCPTAGTWRLCRPAPCRQTRPPCLGQAAQALRPRAQPTSAAVRCNSCSSYMQSIRNTCSLQFAESSLESAQVHYHCKRCRSLMQTGGACHRRKAMWLGWPLLGSNQGNGLRSASQHAISAGHRSARGVISGYRLPQGSRAHQTCSAARAGCRR